MNKSQLIESIAASRVPGVKAGNKLKAATRIAVGSHSVNKFQKPFLIKGFFMPSD